MHPSVGYYPVQNWIIASRWMHNWCTLASRRVSLKLEVRELVDDCVFDLLMNPETAVTFTHGHFNKVVFAVVNCYPLITISVRYLNMHMLS